MNMDGLLVSVIVHDLNLAWTSLPVRPREADAPLSVNADGILSFPIASKRLQSVGRQRPQGLQGRRRVQDRKPFGRLSFKSAEGFHKPARGEALRLLVAVAQDHEG